MRIDLLVDEPLDVAADALVLLGEFHRRFLKCHPGTCCRDASLDKLQTVPSCTTASYGAGGALEVPG